MDPSGVLPAVAVSCALLLCNGFFVAAEYAMVRVRRTQLVGLAERGDVRARMARRIADNLERYVSTVQVGVTAASLALGLVGEPAVARLLEPLLGGLVAVSEPLFHAMSFAVSFVLVSYVTLVVAELAPKYIAIGSTLPIALWTAYPLHFVSIVLYPFIWLVNRSAERLVRLVGISPRPELDVHSGEELRLLVAASTRQGILQESERVIVEHALLFSDKLVRQVMLPRTEMVAVRSDAPLQLIRELALKHPAGIAVYGENVDDIVGVLTAYDFIGIKPDALTARDAVRPPLAVPEALRLDQALAELRRSRKREAVVVDEFGGTAGLITLDDILEELVGELWDEDQQSAPELIRKNADGSFRIDGLTPLHDVRDRLSVRLGDAFVDTAGGLVTERLGRLAQVGDAIEVDDVRFEVVALDENRVAELRAVRTSDRA